MSHRSGIFALGISISVGFKLLSTSSMVHGLPSIKNLEYVCEVCTLSKQQRSHFPSGRLWRAPKPLELVHTDICSPFDPISDGAFTIFKSFKSHVEVKSGCKIKILRSDKGGEYTSNEFRDYCRKNGIKQ